MESDEQYSYYGYNESDNIYENQYEDQFEDQYSDDCDDEDQYIYGSDCGHSDDNVTFQDIPDFDEGLNVSDDDSDDSEVIYQKQYLNDDSDSESAGAYTKEYSKSSVIVKYNDSRCMEQNSFEHNDYDDYCYYSRVSGEDDYNQHTNMLFKEKNVIHGYSVKDAENIQVTQITSDKEK